MFLLQENFDYEVNTIYMIVNITAGLPYNETCTFQTSSNKYFHINKQMEDACQTHTVESGIVDSPSNVDSEKR